MDAGEATINPDGSSSYEPPTDAGGGAPPLNDTDGFDEGFDVPPLEELSKGMDPAIFLVVAFLLCCGLYYLFFKRNTQDDDNDDFFASLDCDKVKPLSLSMCQHSKGRFLPNGLRE